MRNLLITLAFLALFGAGFGLMRGVQYIRMAMAADMKKCSRMK